MQTDNILSHHVEAARQKLHDLQNKYGFGHASVLKQSMVLDELINQYQYTYYRRKKIRLFKCS
ncbi:aspartyl-phosphate phosphatase Spo0E family protein [Paenibacillus sp. RC334]|uniref:aspartyl-phosphate phosphatase Spo0E family protein n=1 Tax=Paenibacillus sp. RC334 TaxID=3045840 RepID=UPI0024BB822C|nr:aspartyl-phosphate phosphatase Spo0E family protein [Paenibacillus sp. RC334]